MCSAAELFLKLVINQKTKVMEQIIRKRSELADLVKRSQPFKVRFRFFFKAWIINKAINIVERGFETPNKTLTKKQ